MLIDRVPVEIPLRCYGVEYDAQDPVCKSCSHKAGCISALGSRAGKVPLSRVQFNLTPANFPELSNSGSIENLYQSLYRVVFKDKEPDSLYKLQKAGNLERRLNDLADEAGCSLRLYILAVMLSRKSLATDGRFFANYLLSANSVSIVKSFSEMAREQYGAFDHETLGKLTDEDELLKAKEAIVSSEILAGKWILGYKIRKSGSPLSVFYTEYELRLHPAWLAIEGSYIEHHNNAEGISKAVSDHRMEVRRVRRWLMKYPHVASLYFEMRGDLFGSAVATVLHSRGYHPDHFEAPSIVHDAIKFWSRLGLAIQHLDCLKMARVLD